MSGTTPRCKCGRIPGARSSRSDTVLEPHAVGCGEGICGEGDTAPETALIGEEVTITVFERRPGTAVAGVGVWALPATDLATDASNREDMADITVKKGSFLGRANDQGEVTHKFDKVGGYYLVAVKDGYAPGFGKITINPHVRVRPVPVSPSLKPAAARPIALVKNIVTYLDSATNRLRTGAAKQLHGRVT